MKTLYLIRHAKSSWSDPSLKDFDRPLNKRGKRDTPIMAGYLKDLGVKPSFVLSSPAVRALTTCRGFAKVLDLPPHKIAMEEQLYHASEEGMMKVIETMGAALESLMVFGHNPGLTELANILTGGNIVNVPTCGIVGIRLDCDSWDTIAYGSGRLLFFEFPKKQLKTRAK